jgi:hypothetical protein
MDKLEEENMVLIKKWNIHILPIIINIEENNNH